MTRCRSGHGWFSRLRTCAYALCSSSISTLHTSDAPPACCARCRRSCTWRTGACWRRAATASCCSGAASTRSSGSARRRASAEDLDGLTDPWMDCPGALGYTGIGCLSWSLWPAASCASVTSWQPRQVSEKSLLGHSTPRANTSTRPWCTRAVMWLSGSSSPSKFQRDSRPAGVTCTALHSTTSTNPKRPRRTPVTHAHGRHVGTAAWRFLHQA